MMHGRREVTVRQFPETLTGKQGEIFIRELDSCMSVDRPCLVLDCSTLGVVDGPAIHLLLCCLVKAMKRNGDVRLGGVSPAARAVLASSGVDRLFSIYDFTADAVSSFYRGVSDTYMNNSDHEIANDIPASAA